VIAQETIDAVRQISIVSFIGERVQLDRRGVSHIGLCPFHHETFPSFHVDQDRGYFYCYGCNVSGNVIGFLQQLDGLSFPDAVCKLAKWADIPVRATTGRLRLVEAPPPPVPRSDESPHFSFHHDYDGERGRKEFTASGLRGVLRITLAIVPGIDDMVRLTHELQQADVIALSDMLRAWLDSSESTPSAMT